MASQVASAAARPSDPAAVTQGALAQASAASLALLVAPVSAWVISLIKIESHPTDATGIVGVMRYVTYCASDEVRL